MMWKKLHIRPTETGIALGLKTATLIVVTLALFGQDLTIVFSDALQSETTSYILAIPFLFSYLIYRKRKMLRTVIALEHKNQPKETRHIPTIAGILLTIVAILLYWYGSYTFTPLEYHMLMLPVFVAGVSLIFFNTQTVWQLAFPTAFLLFLVPPPSEILYTIGATLSVASSEASNAIVNALGIPSVLTSEYNNPTLTIIRQDGTPLAFAVDIACSGIYSLIGFFLFAAFIAYIIRDKPWKKAAILVTGLPLIYLLNIVRITTILLIGFQYGEELALQVFHLLGGWILVFLGTLLLLLMSEKVLKTQIYSNPAEKCLQCNPESQSAQAFCLSCGRIIKPPDITINRRDLAKLTAIALTIILLTSIQAPVFTIAQGPPIVMISTPSGQQVSKEILPQIAGYDLSFWYRDTDFEARAQQDMSLLYLYSSVNDSEDLVFVGIEIASTLSRLHPWETCLVSVPESRGWQPRVTQIELKEVQLAQNPPLIGRFFVFTYVATDETQAVLYWRETARFATSLTSEQKYVKLSLIVYPENAEDLPSIENRLTSMATAITNYWQPIITWSQITLLISQHGASLAAITSILLAVIATFYILETKRGKEANADAYRKLSKTNKQVVDIIRQTEKETMPTLNNIETTYQKATGRPIEEQKLLQKLSALEKTGTVESAIANQRDEPIQIWKTQVTLKQEGFKLEESTQKREPNAKTPEDLA